MFMLEICHVIFAIYNFSEDENNQIRVSKRSRKHKNRKIHEEETVPVTHSEEESDLDGCDSQEEDTSIEKILDPREKFLIFTTGSLTYTPHQIGFKRIKPFKYAYLPIILISILFNFPTFVKIIFACIRENVVF